MATKDQQGTASKVTNKNEVYREITQTLGLVPEWVKTLPDPLLNGIWSQMRDFYLAETVIPNKYKELIGIGVAGATRCRYCQIFHTEAARVFGATDAEIAEACAMASLTMELSTYLNAMGTDFEHFKRETKEIVAYVRKQQGLSGTRTHEARA